MERDDARCVDHQKTGRRDSSQGKTYSDDNPGVENCTLHHPNAFGGKFLFQDGQVDKGESMGMETLL